MFDSTDYSALNWVKSEIEETLKQARNSLEAYVSNTRDEAQLRFCATYLHQVRGTLQMIELYGAALLCEEMEHVTQALLQNKIANRDDAYEVLLRAILQLPTYLDRIKAGHHDVPLVLLPLLNDLRASRNQNLLSDSALFSPDLSVEPPSDEQVEKAEALEQFARKLRPIYQSALVSWFRNNQDREALRRMLAVVDRLDHHADSARQLWWVAGAVLESLTDGGLDTSISIKQLLGQIDREIKRLIDEGIDQVKQNPARDLIKNLLFYVARSESQGKRVRGIKQAFSLDALLPEDNDLAQMRSDLSGPSHSLLSTVYNALNEEMLRINDTLDLYVRNPAESVSNLEQMEIGLQQVADTLGMLGLGILRGRIQEQCIYIHDILSGASQPTDSGLMSIASALLHVESTLAGMAREERHGLVDSQDASSIPATEFHQLSASVINEALADMSKIKYLVSQFSQQPSSHQQLVDIPARLGIIRGGLVMLELNEAGQLIERLQQYLQQDLLTQMRTPSSQQIDALADVITSIEYYLETYLDSYRKRDEILAFGRHSLDLLSASIGTTTEAASPKALKLPVEASNVDDEIIEVYLEEAEEELANIRQQLQAWQRDIDNTAALSIVRRAFHTLKGGGRLVGAVHAGEFAWAIENLLNRIIDRKVIADEAVFNLLWQAVDAFPQLLVAFTQGTAPTLDVDGLTATAQQLATVQTHDTKVSERIDENATTSENQANVVTDLIANLPSFTSEPTAAPASQPTTGSDEDDVQSLYWREAVLRVEELRQIIAQASVGETMPWSQLIRLFHSLHGSSRMAGIDPVAELALTLKLFADSLSHKPTVPVDAVLSVFTSAVELITAMSHGTDITASDLDQTLKAIAQINDGLTAPAPAIITESPAVSVVPAADTEVVNVFLEEAEELLRTIDEQLNQVGLQHESGPWVTQLHRDLHTLKGGARMADLPPIANLSHQLESLLSAVLHEQVAVTEKLLDIVQRGHDRLHHLIECVQNGTPLIDADDIRYDIDQLLSAPTPAVIETVAAPVASAVIARSKDDEAAVAEEILRELSAPVKRGSGETVRVAADTIDKLVNIAAEQGIFESRMAQQLAMMRYNFTELEQTVARLFDRLRKLELDADTRFLRREQDITSGEFDSLEFDRFSQTQQLARSLMESGSDLISLQKLLYNQTRETETLLTQQSRLTSELQDGLMRTRMVPFSGIVSRLRRLTRQVCNELEKSVELDVFGEHVELDRTLLNRLVPALEHLIRNGIDHGIENTDERKKSGKSPTGHLVIHVAHEGPEVVISLSDDGRGLDIERIRAKAIELGLLNPGVRLSNNELMQFILESGFSTARKLTQLSGRGVGMDVVNREVKQLSGSLHMQSSEGAGTRFTIRLPLTLATQNTILVNVGNDTYALPLRGFVGMTRGIPVQDEQGREVFHYNGINCLYLHLSDLLGTTRRPLDHKRLPPLLIYRTGDYHIALQTDRLKGHQTIISKSVGPQLSAIQGISGGTILADGRVALILDLHALVRNNLAHVNEYCPLPESSKEAESQQPLVMIVDDSITMRKVTSRLLLRNHYRVITANDGVEAATLLQDTIPDIILLDVEMPRMDGFELASMIRHTDSLKHIPIIMITSRTGAKHRTRASELGVDHYFGKPYNEQELLNTMQDLLSQEHAHG